MGIVSMCKWPGLRMYWNTPATSKYPMALIFVLNNMLKVTCNPIGSCTDIKPAERESCDAGPCTVPKEECKDKVKMLLLFVFTYC